MTKKPIKNFPGYWITSDGQVWSDKTQKFLKLHESHGYLQVDLSLNGQGYHFRVHRLVAEAFIPNPNNLPEVNHKDENRFNNNVNNLEWSTSKENANWGTRNKKISEKNSKAIEMYNKDTLEFVRSFSSLKEAATFLGKDGGQANICKALKNEGLTAYGYIWKYQNL